MGKLVTIKKSRKEHKCNKCGKTIEKGMPYLKGIINFHPDIVRCIECGLQLWEVTTSDFLLSLGTIINSWDRDNPDSNVIESLISDLEELRDETDDKFSNMPEGLQSSSNGELLENRVEMLDGVIDELNNIDIDSIKDEVLQSWLNSCQYTSDFEEKTYDEVVALKDIEGLDQLHIELTNSICESIEEALENIELI